VMAPTILNPNRESKIRWFVSRTSFLGRGYDLGRRCLIVWPKTYARYSDRSKIVKEPLYFGRIDLPSTQFMEDNSGALSFLQNSPWYLQIGPWLEFIIYNLYQN
jgi:hypothetical protein